MPDRDTESLLRSKVASLEQLLEVFQRAALEQGNRLEEERKKLYEILANAPAIIGLYTGPDHTLEFANERLIALSGRSDMLGKPLREALPEVEGQGYGGKDYLAILDHVYQTATPFFANEAAVTIFDPDGIPREFFLNFALIPLKDADGKVRSIVAHSVEVTDLVDSRRHAEGLAQSLAELADASRAINSQLSVIATIDEAIRRACRVTRSEAAVMRASLEPGSGIVTRGCDRSGDDARSWAEELAFALDEAVASGATVSFDDARNPSVGHCLATPIHSHDGEVLGAIAVAGRAEPFRPSDEDVLEQLAQTTAIAAQNAFLYEQQHRIAETLQFSLLPRDLPQLPEIQIDARYRASTAGTHVGGDWYDAFILPDGRMGVALGDVAGKGIRAAALMGQLRIALRAYAFEGHSVSGVVESMDRLATEMNHDTMVTLVYLVIDTNTSTIDYVCAGHPPPIVVAGNRTQHLELTALPLGVGSRYEEFTQRRINLDPGSLLMLYSDGLVERRGESLEEGMGRLAEASTVEEADVGRYCEHILEAMDAASATDDVALLVLRLLPVATERLNIRIQSRPEEAAGVRRAIGRWLEQVGFDPQWSLDLIMASGEAVANAIEHAYFTSEGSIVITAERSSEAVTLTIRDFGRWKTGSRPNRGRGLMLMRALVDEVQVDPRAVGTTVTLRKSIMQTVRA